MNDNRRVGYSLKRAYQAMRTCMDNALRDLGLTTAQWGALHCLEMNTNLSSAEMARLNSCTPQSMNAIVLHLEAAGLIQRQPHATHGTLLPAHLTPTGRRLLAEGDRRVQALERRMLAGVNDEEQQRLSELLERCTRALQVDFQGYPEISPEHDDKVRLHHLGATP